MGITTKIEYCDSTANAQMGCNGCELWDKQKGGECYAAILTSAYAGRRGWPASFNDPALFVERLAESMRWPDLTGLDRPGKPWLNGYPRIIFLDDMGDTFTESLPLDWLLDYVPAMAAAPHIYLFLTKRPKRMHDFFKIAGRVPDNFWLGTSMTSNATAGRLRHMESLKADFPSARLWLSLEPLWSRIHIESPAIYDWWCVGGQSGLGRKPAHPAWVRGLRDDAGQAGISFFFKQWGAWLPVDAPTPGVSDRLRLIMDELGNTRRDDRSLAPGDQLFENVGKHEAGAWLDGRHWREMPAPSAPAPIATQPTLFQAEWKVSTP